VNLSHLTTETADPRFAGIDTMSVGELAATMNAADATVPAAVAEALPRITEAIEATAERVRAGGRLVYVGAGTPGRLGVLDASECPPTFGTPPEQVFAIIAGGESAIVSPCEGAEDDEEAGAAAVDAAGVGPLDTVVGIASSGRTPYVVAAVRRARELGALTVGLSCNAGTPLSAAAAHAVEVLVGPEVVSGSTRLKAGTAQKLVLNMFSTIVMVRLGKTYGNLMVDVKATNGKLRERAVRIVRTITGAGREEALAVLDANGFNVKQAVVAARFGLAPRDAAARLAGAGGRLRAALEERA
jgi:N-acetylmuramic acid 6-phosphate etherase